MLRLPHIPSPLRGLLQEVVESQYVVGAIHEFPLRPDRYAVLQQSLWGEGIVRENGEVKFTIKEK